MIDQLFEWSGDWTQLDAWQFVFYDVRLKRGMGSFPAGSIVFRALLDFRAGTLTLTDNIIHAESFEIRAQIFPAS